MEHRVANVSSSHLNKELQKAQSANLTCKNLGGKQSLLATLQEWSQPCLPFNISWGINMLMPGAALRDSALLCLGWGLAIIFLKALLVILMH